MAARLASEVPNTDLNTQSKTTGLIFFFKLNPILQRLKGDTFPNMLELLPHPPIKGGKMPDV